MKKQKNKIRKAERRKMLLEQRKKKSRTIIVVSVLAIAVMCLGVYFVISTGENEDIQVNKPSESTMYQDETNVWVPLSGITDEAEFYEYDSNGIGIQFFAVEGSDGEVRIALDACDVCYSAKKGYTQAGDDMQCINCGNKYSIDGLGTENIGGGCWPSYIPIQVNGDNVYIKISDLENKRDMF
jgi:uncharacterized membrane protein